MKRGLTLMATIGLLAGCRGAIAGETLAVSRLVTEYAAPPSATTAVSRLLVMYAAEPGATISLSRLVTEFAPEPVGTVAVSRLTTAWTGYKVPDAVKALRLSAGLSPADAGDVELLNVVLDGGAAVLLDVLDVFRLLAYALHPETLP